MSQNGDQFFVPRVGNFLLEIGKKHTFCHWEHDPKSVIKMDQKILIRTSGQEIISFKGISYLQLSWPFCSAEWNHLCNFGKGHYEKLFCEIILSMDQWFRRQG